MRSMPVRFPAGDARNRVHPTRPETAGKAMPTAAELRAATPRSTSGGRRASAVRLVDEAPRDQRPHRLPGAARAQVKPDPTRSARHLHADLEEPKTKRVHLDLLELGAMRGAAKLVHEHVGRAVEQEPKLVRPEPMAAQPVRFQDVLEILDRVLTGLATCHVALIVEILCAALERRHDEAD